MLKWWFEAVIGIMSIGIMRGMFMFLFIMLIVSFILCLR